uniref:Uncharacterized protein n=1 Tax=Tanacetum cinerariifolium TaxID=118510 RepID=A0A699JNF7_TANCI|nr:hypothetical protein [Tanacetum cinerariifolium]
MYDSLERAITMDTSLDVEQDRGNVSKTQSKATPNEPSSPGTSLGDGPRRHDTIGDTIAQTRSENVSKQSNNPPLLRVNILRSREDRLKLNELMELCTKLFKRVLNLETTKTAQAKEIANLKKRVKRLERKRNSRTHGLKRLYKGRINDEYIFDIDVLNDNEVVVEDVNAASIAIAIITAAITVVSIDDITLAQALMKKKDQIKFNDQEARRLQAEFDEQDRLAEEKAQQIKDENLAWDDVQAMIDANYELAAREKVEDDKESEELKRCLEIIPDDGDDVTINATPLSIMTPIIDYKIYKEGKKSYFQFFRADGNSQMYLTFSKMLKNFDR